MQRGAWGALALVIGWSGVSHVARAADVDANADAGTPVEALATYEREVDAALARRANGALAGEDCTTACRALGSMRRAAERICAMDVGAACEDARRRTAQAENRVSEACPSCAAPVARTDAESRSGAAPESTPPQRGGCASCATTGGGASGGLTYALAALGVLSWLRRRRATDARRIRARKEL